MDTESSSVDKAHEGTEGYQGLSLPLVADAITRIQTLINLAVPLLQVAKTNGLAKLNSIHIYMHLSNTTSHLPFPFCCDFSFQSLLYNLPIYYLLL